MWLKVITVNSILSATIGFLIMCMISQCCVLILVILLLSLLKVLIAVVLFVTLVNLKHFIC